MTSHYSYMAQLAAARRGRQSAAAGPPVTPTPPSIVAARAATPPSAALSGLGLPPIGSGAAPSPGGQYRQALAQAAQTRAAAKAAAAAAMPPVGVGGLGGSPAGAGGSPARANATAALFGGGSGAPLPSYDGYSFVLGLPGGANGAGAGYTDPGVRHERAIQQGANALFGMLTAPGGDAPDGPYALALADSARAVAAARADIDAEGSLFGSGYGTLTPGNQATRAAAAQLAAELGVVPMDSGRATAAWPPRGRGGGATTSGTPPWRLGMAENPYLLGASPPLPTSPTVAAYMRALQKAHAGSARSSDGGPVPPSITLAREGRSNAPSQPFDVQQWYDAVGFDPTGPGLGSSAARGVVDKFLYGEDSFPFLRARELGRETAAAALRRLPPEPPVDNAKDARRHAEWMGELTREYGPEVARRVGNAYEITFPGELGSRLMDLHNNDVGISLMSDSRNANRAVSDVIAEALEAGVLQTRPLDVPEGSAPKLDWFSRQRDAAYRRYSSQLWDYINAY